MLFRSPALPERLRLQFGAIHTLLINKYYFDDFNQKVFARGSTALGTFFWRIGDEVVIDNGLVNGSARLVARASQVARQLQSGYLYHYAFAIITGLAVLVGWLLLAG